MVKQTEASNGYPPAQDVHCKPSNDRSGGFAMINVLRNLTSCTNNAADGRYRQPRRSSFRTHR